MEDTENRRTFWLVQGYALPSSEISLQSSQSFNRFYRSFPTYSAAYVRLSLIYLSSDTERSYHAPCSIITLTANDIILGLYKRMLFGKPEDD